MPHVLCLKIGGQTRLSSGSQKSLKSAKMAGSRRRFQCLLANRVRPHLASNLRTQNLRTRRHIFGSFAARFDKIIRSEKRNLKKILLLAFCNSLVRPLFIAPFFHFLAQYEALPHNSIMRLSTIIHLFTYFLMWAFGNWEHYINHPKSMILAKPWKIE